MKAADSLGFILRGDIMAYYLPYALLKKSIKMFVDYFSLLWYTRETQSSHVGYLYHEEAFQLSQNCLKIK
jgi:hypothetical protein